MGNTAKQTINEYVTDFIFYFCRHWRPGQPDDWTEHGLGEGGEDCGQITYDGMLNDAHCSTKMKYICEM